jgi:hypothetical protein
MMYDDGSEITQLENGMVISRDAGSNVWQDDPAAAPAGWSVFTTDAQESARMSQGYPANGQAWDTNAAMLGISRLIDTAGRTYASVKGSMPATYAGQNGQTYANGQPAGAASSSGGLLPLVLLGALAFALVG